MTTHSNNTERNVVCIIQKKTIRRTNLITGVVTTHVEVKFIPCINNPSKKQRISMK